ncbi:hypothetical protein FOXG_15911 [Fusarium oxysporum f. sp. lycopersici 4287]|uniref:Uncharacterized protein n=1 Tax=Fusarium oxysporum f. sp. lycopersici (strain 4287 / CBS 123668 / FGSC 9935 / NRRL 34936) TaxID=426428 RepID=A0A0J9W604_FUSO4|nr:hypothetical protein FOXG_15911 [Fusarium oxysporum f. sp. lycopersici 4287]KNB18499.1 hypothetical protein FOXG_15911 [Fusarium oxysporum f. sp. lycopersici 4287]
MAGSILGIEGVACQRFFPSREGSRWFQVNFKTERCNASALKAKRTPTKPQVAPRDLTSEGSTHLQQIMEREAGYQNALNQSYMTGNNASRETFAATNWDPYEDDDNYDDSEDDDSEDDYDDSGYWSNIDGPSATPYREMSAGVLRGSTKVVFDEFLEILFQLCVTLCTETFVDGQPSSTLLVYFSGVLGFSADCHKFQLARQYCPKFSAIIYKQRILLLELALPVAKHYHWYSPRPRAAQFEP